MDSDAWRSAFADLVRSFVAHRPIDACTVKVTLADGWNQIVQGMEPGPGPLHVTLYPYSEPDEMLRDDEGLPRTPTALVVPMAAITSVELLSDAPTERSFGFGLPSEDRSTTES